MIANGGDTYIDQCVVELRVDLREHDVAHLLPRALVAQVLVDRQPQQAVRVLAHQHLQLRHDRSETIVRHHEVAHAIGVRENVEKHLQGGIVSRILDVRSQKRK